MKNNKPAPRVRYAILLILLHTSFLVQSQDELDFTINHILDTENITESKINLPSIIFEGIEKEKIVCYETNLKGRKLSLEVVYDKVLYSYDTVIVTDPSTYKDELTIIKNERNPQDIVSFLVQARYTIDVKSGVVLRKTIQSMAPLDPLPGYQFGVERYRPYFWIDYDDVLNYIIRETFVNDGGEIIDVKNIFQNMTDFNLISDIKFGH